MTANPVVVGIFVGLFGLGSVYFQFVAMPKLRAAGDVDAGIAPAPAMEPSLPEITETSAMDLTESMLRQTEWVEQSAYPVRLRFRRDGSGYYEREAAPGQRQIHENLLYRLEGATLHLKFAHARLWVEIPAEAQAGRAAPGARVGERVLLLPHDPYAATVEGKPSGPLVLASDTGAALP